LPNHAAGIIERSLRSTSCVPLTGGGSSLHRINLGTGAAALVGTIDNGSTLRGIALSPAAAPEPSSVVSVSIGLVGVALSAMRRRTSSASFSIQLDLRPSAMKGVPGGKLHLMD
jgi:hypothetical protein